MPSGQLTGRGALPYFSQQRSILNLLSARCRIYCRSLHGAGVTCYYRTCTGKAAGPTTQERYEAHCGAVDHELHSDLRSAIKKARTGSWKSKTWLSTRLIVEVIFEILLRCCGEISCLPVDFRVIKSHNHTLRRDSSMMEQRVPVQATSPRKGVEQCGIGNAGPPRVTCQESRTTNTLQHRMQLLCHSDIKCSGQGTQSGPLHRVGFIQRRFHML